MKKIFIVITVFALFSFASTAIGKRATYDSRPDPASKECTTCHGGERFLSASTADSDHGPHLIGLDYRTISKADQTLINADMLDTKILLIEGRVSCITCHRAYDKSAHLGPMLRMDNSGSGLCRKCHKK
ncbi:MAG: hypothetical protein V3V95_00665 [Thermodesulfobacteriota bacterium]